MRISKDIKRRIQNVGKDAFIDSMRSLNRKKSAINHAKTYCKLVFEQRPVFIPICVKGVKIQAKALKPRPGKDKYFFEYD